jgi:hypothetical protein
MKYITKIKLSSMRKNPNIALPAKITREYDPSRGTIMTSFVHIEYSKDHPGVARVESAIASAQQIRQGFSGKRALSTLLLSAFAAAVMVVAYEVMDTVAEGHLLVMWIALWAAAFVSLAVFAGTARHLATRMKVGLDDWSRAQASARADARLWATAQTDARVMADLQAAASRHDNMDVASVAAVSPSAVATSLRAKRLTRNFASASF